MDKRVAFIAFSDIHIENWKQFNDNNFRLYDNKVILDTLKAKCEKYNCPALFCGDLFDNPKSLSNLVIQEAFQWIQCFKYPIYAIPGNHDQSEKNTLDHSSPNYITTLHRLFDNFISLNLKSIEHGNYIITGIPYLTNSDQFETAVHSLYKTVKGSPKKKILLIHTDLPGAKDSAGREVDSSSITKRLSRLFKGWDLVLSGHIHRPQVLRKSKPPVIMLGATHQQRTSDANTSMGYWLIYNDLSYKFIRFKFTRGFIYLKEGQEKPDDHHFYIQERKKVISEGSGMRQNFSTKNPIKLAKSYLKVKGIKSKSKRKLLIKYLESC